MYCLTFTYISCTLLVNNYSALDVYTHDSYDAHASATWCGATFTNRVTLQNKITQSSTNLKGSGVYLGWPFT